MHTPHVNTHTYTSYPHRMEVDRIYRLEPQMVHTGVPLFYIIRPDIDALTKIANHIQADNDREQHGYSIIFLPRKLATSDYVLEREGAYGFVKVHEWKLYLIPLDAHFLSLDLHDSFKTLYLDQDFTMLHSIARSLLQLEHIYGTFPIIHGRGDYAQKVWEVFARLKELQNTRPSISKKKGPSITEVVIFDRQCDLVTPLLSQLTYEGILDDVYRVRSGYVEIPKMVAEKDQDSKLRVNSTDPVFEEIRSLHFSAVPNVLFAISKDLKETYHIGKMSSTVPQLKSFVQRLPELTKKHDSLAIHIKVSESIVAKKKDEEFSRQLFFERAILEAADKLSVTEYIEECIQRQMYFQIPLRLMCLMSTTNNGIKPKYFDQLKHLYLNSYGHEHLVTLRNLLKVGLIQHKTDDPPTSSLSARSVSTFKQLSKLLKLVPKDPGSYDVYSPKDMSYVYGGAYKPLSCAAIESVIRSRSWKELDEVKSWGQPEFTRHQPVSARLETQRAMQDRKVVLVYFIGGCTFSELNALRFLGEREGSKYSYIVATTNLIGPGTMIDSMLE